MANQQDPHDKDLYPWYLDGACRRPIGYDLHATREHGSLSPALMPPPPSEHQRIAYALGIQDAMTGAGIKGKAGLGARVMRVEKDSQPSD